MFSTVRVFGSESFKTCSNWTRACWSSDARFVACGGADGILYIWDSDTGASEAKLKEHRSGICSTVWDPNGKSNVFSASDRTIVQWI